MNSDDRNNQRDKCPYCASLSHKFWASEFGYSVVRCSDCKLLFISPMPDAKYVDTAVKAGFHENIGLNVKAKRVSRKVYYYKKIISSVFPDLLNSNKPILWVDVGCGYGELLQALECVAPNGSEILGFEPMEAKAKNAMARGLNVTNDYLKPNLISADVVSMVDIFSHIPDFHGFLKIVASNLKPGGYLFLETGNLADLELRDQFSGELGLPDHLVFASEAIIKGYLEKAGFSVMSIRRIRTDTLMDFIKSIIKRLLGRPAVVRMPYSSKYRQLLIRARLA
jgi:SAM-dependent methyltransferase